MSAIGNPQVHPVEVPRAPAPPVSLPPAPPKPKRPWSAFVVLGLFAIAALAIWQFWLKPRPATPAAVVTIRTGRVIAGPIQRTIRVAGQTTAREYVDIKAPILRSPDSGPMVLMTLVQSGKRVSKGEMLASIDSKQITDHIDDVLDEVEQAESDTRKRMAELSVDTESLRQNIRVAASQNEKSQLDVKGGQLRTPIERELLKLSAEEAEAAHKQAMADEPFYKMSQAADLKMLDIAKIRTHRHLARHQNDVPKLTMNAPMDGLAVVQQTFRGGEWGLVQAGDQLSPGTLFLKVVRPDRMQVEAAVNQSDSDMLRIGQECIIHLDAFPGLAFRGRIHSIGAIAQGVSRMQNYWVRSVPVKIAIDGGDDRLIPDLSASADVILKEDKSATLVPLGAVHRLYGKDVVFVKNGSNFQRREVQLGLRNNTHAAVQAGLKEGDEVALDRPAKSI
jgi:multidrug efflux pump subunit AcrA (membrane-fusion protein)